jgi:hypothetical protein
MAKNWRKFIAEIKMNSGIFLIKRCNLHKPTPPYNTRRLSYKYHKIKNYLFLNWSKKIGPVQRIVVIFTQKTGIKLSKIWFWYPGSGKNLFQIPDPGSGFATLPPT